MVGEDADRWSDLSTSVGHLLRLARQGWNAEWQRQQPRKLSSAQFTVLAVLADALEIDQQTLGSRAGVDKSTIGQLVDRLHTAGLIASRVDPSSRRRKLLRITDAGRAAFEEAASVQRAVQSHMLAPLSPDEILELQRLLQLAARTRQPGDPHADGGS